ncbi:MAG TPA: hypothetical protein ENG50_01095 [Candidatus Altiarchaeales archaeon]|nr:hypothetical protein [Candidatus Altiarchaeales archaeon]
MSHEINIVNAINFGAFLLILFFMGYIIIESLRILFLPEKIGKITEIKSNVPGKASVSVIVKLKNGEFVAAEVSPCCLCLDRLKVGDLVAVREIGNRKIIYKPVKWKFWD